MADLALASLRVGRLPPAPEELPAGMILAEPALAGILVLGSADNHMLRSDEQGLHPACNEANLNRVVILHPRNLLRTLH